ncbi:MAG: AAA family ATPase, partial [Gemmatimonadetes bacterium]|nr:AAA family ATPase [Gemmatimonadota bacterium]
MRKHYRLKVFGVPEIVAPDGGILRFRTKKQLAVLTYLALEARYRPTSKSTLVEFFWPEVLEEKGRHSLAQSFTALRNALGPDALRTELGTVQLVANIVTELDLLSREFAEISMLETPLLELETCGGVAFSHWVDGVRAMAAAKVRSVLLDELRHERRDGRLDKVREHATVLFELDPLNDDAVLALAEDTLLRNDRGQAITILRAHREGISEQGREDQPPDLKRLLRRIEEGREEKHPTPYPRERREEFVGRDILLSKLEAIWGETRSNNACSCLLTGSPGIGKTSILRKFSDGVSVREWQVFSVTCHKMGRRVPYAAVAELMHEICRNPTVSGTDPMWLAEASRVIPELKTLYPGISDPINIDADSVRPRVAEAICRMLDPVVEDAPFLLTIDDMHNMDEASRDVLYFLFKRISSKAFMVLGTASSRAAGRVESLDISNTEAVEWQHTTEVGPLDRRRAHELVERLLSATQVMDSGHQKEILERILELSHGNPHLMEVLVLDWREHGSSSLAITKRWKPGRKQWNPPETMKEIFDRQYRDVSQHARHLLELLAIAGKRMTAEDARKLLDLPRSKVDRCAIELVDRELVRFEKGGLTIKNELHQAYTASRMSEDSRRYFHGLLAAPHAVAGDERGVHSDLERAYHLVSAEMLDDATQLVLEAGENAVSQGAAIAVEQLIESIIQSRDSTFPPALPLLLTKALSAQTRYESAYNVLNKWDLTKAEDLDPVEVLLLQAEIIHRGRLEDDETIVATAEAAVRSARENGTQQTLVNALQVEAELSYDLGNSERLNAVATEAATIAKTTNDEHARAHVLLTHAYCLLVSGELVEAAESFSESAELLEKLKLRSNQRRALNGLGITLTGLGDYEAAARHFREAISIAELIGDTVGTANSLSNLGVVFTEPGKFVE